MPNPGTYNQSSTALTHKLPSLTDDNVLLALHNAGNSTRKIEQIVGLDHTRVARRLQRLTPRKTTEIYKSMRADIFAEKQRQWLMMSNTPKLIRDSKAQRDLATCIGILYDKERLERGQSTSNISLHAIIDLSVYKVEGNGGDPTKSGEIIDV